MKKKILLSFLVLLTFCNVFGQDISTSGTLTAMNTTYGSPSATPTSFTVSGNSLTTDITVTPPGGFEVSTSSGTDYGATVTLTPSSGTVGSTTVYVRLKASAIVLSSPYSGNIVVSSTGATSQNVATVSSTVGAKPLTITGISINNKQYSGTTAATISGTVALSGVEAGDLGNVVVGGAPSATFTTAAAADNKAVTVSGYTIGGSASGNYSLTQPAGLTANITARAIIITGISIGNKEYDGNAMATISGTASSIGVLPGDAATVTLGGTPSAAFTTAAVGTNKAVTVSGYTISGSASGNYSLTQPIGLTANIIAKSDATLSDLALSSGTLDPLFASNILNYTTYVSNATSSINFTPTVTNEATVKINGMLVSSGSASGSIALAAGNNIFTIVVVSQDGTVTNAYNVKVTRLGADQVLTDQTGDATVNNTVTQVVVISETKPVIVTVSGGTTTSPSVDYGGLIDQGTGTVPQTSVTSSFAQMEIPPATTVTASSSGWDGVLSTPAITTYTLPAIPGQIITPGLIIEVGSPDISLSFDKAVRLQLTGQAGMRIARVHNNIYTEILTTGPEDSQAAGDLLPADGSFKINVGNDAVIWTKVFSKFISFSQKTDLNVALVEADKTELTADLIRGSNTDPSKIVSPLILPQTGSFGSAITWVSSDPSVISTDGQSIFREVLGSGNKTVTLTATITKGLITETRSFTLTVPELPNQAPTMASVTNQAICSTTALQIITLSGITGGPESAQTTSQSITSDNPAMFSELSVIDNKVNYRLNPGVSGVTTITLTVKDNGGTENGGTDSFSQKFTLTASPLPVSVISSNLGAEISKGLTALLTVPVTGSGVIYSWANAAGIINGQNTSALSVRPAVTTTYTLTITNGNGCVAVQSFTVNVLEDFKTLDVNNILTPNGDRTNDFLVIKNLDMYPGNTLKIFDRAGREIFKKVNYQNDWDGNFKGSPLAEDTYYYIIDFATAHRNRLEG